MPLQDTIQDRLHTAMKARDEKLTQTLRLLVSALKNEQISIQRPLTDDDVQKVMAQQVKQLKDACVDYDRGGRVDLVTLAQEEIAVLSAYLPEQLSHDALANIVARVIASVSATSPADIGKVMGAVMVEVRGRADGNHVRDMVSALLTK